MANKEKFIRLEEVIKLTGYKRNYIYQLVHAKKIPHYKPTDRTLFFRESEIIDWIESCKINADYEQIGIENNC